MRDEDNRPSLPPKRPLNPPIVYDRPVVPGPLRDRRSRREYLNNLYALESGLGLNPLDRQHSSKVH